MYFSQVVAGGELQGVRQNYNHFCFLTCQIPGGNKFLDIFKSPFHVNFMNTNFLITSWHHTH